MKKLSDNELNEMLCMIGELRYILHRYLHVSGHAKLVAAEISNLERIIENEYQRRENQAQ